MKCQCAKTKHFSARLAALGLSIVFSLALCAALTGCGGSPATADYAAGDSYASAPMNAAETTAADGGSGESTFTPEQMPQNGSRKIVYNATMRLQSTTFETARAAILAAVTDCNAYLEYSDASGSAEEADRSVSYTVRVPVDGYSKFIAAAGEAGSVQSLTESAQDITSSYIDVQARLTALKAQRDRLNELADSAETTADLLEIESQLSDVQYQLENYTQQMRAMDNQVSYSTVEIYLNEVEILTPSRTSFIDRATAAFGGGWSGFVAFVQGLALVAIYLWPLLLLVVAVVIVLLATRPLRAKHHAARMAKRAAAQAARAAAPQGYQPAIYATPAQDNAPAANMADTVNVANTGNTQSAQTPQAPKYTKQ